jgi:hypothetical protein
MKCSKCGAINDFYQDQMHKKSWMCKGCIKLYNKERRRYLKLKCVKIKGGKCIKCGYDKNLAALEFHHEDRNKDFQLSNLASKSWDRIEKELQKCVLLCSNCHMEEHHPEYTSNIDFVFDHSKSLKKACRGTFKNKTIGCKKCGNEIKSPRRNQEYCSLNCSNNSRINVYKPTCEELKDLMLKNTWTKIGKIFGVSDNSVRGWAKRYGIFVERKNKKERC